MVDAVLDRIPEFDERSRSFNIRPLLPTIFKPRGYTWRIPAGRYVLDQGQEGACVGFSFAHDLLARPVVVPDVYELQAKQIYNLAKTLDPWEGENYEGTSVLAGAKALMQLGFLAEYRWAFTLDDLTAAIGYKGPAVLGVWWREGMLNPDADGFIHYTGEIVGGHAIMCNAVNVKKGFFTLTNSWGHWWGHAGACYISAADMALMLADDGEACIPVKRTKGSF
jgi:hypothetical protein